MDTFKDTLKGIQRKNMRNTLKNKNIRKVYKKSGSYGITLPIEIVKELKIREKQKLIIKRSGAKIIISDWEK